MEQAPSAQVVALVRDLMFSSKIIATGRAQNQPVLVVRDPAKLVDTPGQRLLVDLNLEGAIDAAIAWAQAEPGRQTIGFVSHVDADTIRRARNAGIDRVMARSQFTAQLPQLLTASTGK